MSGSTILMSLAGTGDLEIDAAADQANRVVPIDKNRVCVSIPFFLSLAGGFLLRQCLELLTIYNVQCNFSLQAGDADRKRPAHDRLFR